MTAPNQLASVRYLVDHVQAAVDFYTTHLGFTVHTNAAPAFADVIRGPTPHQRGRTPAMPRDTSSRRSLGNRTYPF